MKIFIQNQKTKEFYGSGGWTVEDGGATQFNNISGALNCCLQHSFSDVQILMKFENPEYDISLPIRDFSGQKTERSFSRVFHS